MPDSVNLLAIWEELETLWLYLQRPVVHFQLLGIGLAILIGWALSSWLWYLTKRYYYPWINGWSNKKAQRYADALGSFIENVGFPVLTLIILPLMIQIFEARGMLATLMSQATIFIWVLLAYRLFIFLLDIIVGNQRLDPFQRRLLDPLFWLAVIIWLFSLIINLPVLARVELFSLFDDTSFTLGKLFWTALVLYLLFTLAWVIQEIILSVVAPRTNVDAGTVDAALTIGRYVVLILAVLIILREIGFDPTSLALIGSGLSIGIGFGLQSIISNFISGIVLLFEQSLRPGDVVEVEGVMGTVQHLGIRSTKVQTFDNIEMIIPNEIFFTSKVTTYTGQTRVTRVMLTIGASYQSDPKEVMDVLLNAAQRHGLVLDDPEPAVFFENYGDSSIDFHLAIWVSDPLHRKRVPSDLRLMIWNEFEKRGIEIPFPQRDLHLRSSDVSLETPGIRIKDSSPISENS